MLVVEEEIVEVEGKKITFYRVRCTKCNRVLAYYANRELAEYHAKYWLRCCE